MNLSLNALRQTRSRWLRRLEAFHISHARKAFARDLQRAVQRNAGQMPRRATVLSATNALGRVRIGQCNILEPGLILWFSDVECTPRGLLSTGNYLYVGFNSYFGVFDDVTIGNHVSIAANCYITSATHNFSDVNVPIQSQGLSPGRITIGDDVWIGCGCVILPGVTIGAGSVIGANSLVNRDVPTYEIWGGSPAKRIGTRER